MYSRQNYEDAKAEIENRRVTAIARAEERSRELRERDEAIRLTDFELERTGLLLFKVACEGGDLDAVRKRNQELLAARRKRIVELGHPEDYTDVHYTCQKCRDTGFVDTRMCICLKELLITKNIKSSGMGELIEKQSFENFDLEHYKSSPEAYEKMQSVYKRARIFADNFENKRGNLIFVGRTGSGKTHLSTAIAKVVIGKGYDVLYDSVQNIINDFEQDKFKSGYNQTESHSEKYLECELLIIDDLGTEFVTPFSVSVLYNLLTTRLNKNLSTIISTNLSTKEIYSKYEGRITSRIFGSEYKLLAFEGRDYRIYGENI